MSSTRTAAGERPVGGSDVTWPEYEQKAPHCGKTWFRGPVTLRGGNMHSNTSGTQPSGSARNDDSSGALTRVRIGFNAFWDVALISTFEMALRANGIDPEFVLLSEWHDSAIDAFRNEMIDVSLHNYHTVLYEQQLPATKRVGIKWVYPLFVFKGHHIFISQAHLDKVRKDPRALPVLQLGAGTIQLPEGLYPKDFPEHAEVLSAFLENARVGFERGTDQEIAFRKAYHFAQLEFPAESRINRDPEGLPLWRGPSQSVQSSELCHAFREGLLDLYCGGWQQLYQLRRERYSILLGPDALSIDSFNGLITTERFRHTELLKPIRDAWFCGVSLFTEWTKALRRPDGSGTARARAALESVLLSIQHTSQSREGERILVDAGDEFPVSGIGLTAASPKTRANLSSGELQTSRDLTAICDELKQVVADSEALAPVANLVSEFMSKASLSPKQVAGIVEMSDETVYRWKKAKARPSEEHIAKLRRYAVTSGARPGLNDEIREAFKAERQLRDERVEEWAELLCSYDQFSEAQVESGFPAWQKSEDFGLWTRSQAEYARAQFLRSTEASATGR